MIRILTGDARAMLRTLPAESVHCVVTSPPYYGLRHYGVDGQLGLEPSPAEYIASMVGVFREVRRVLRSDGTLWLNIGDSYAGSNGNGYKQTLHPVNYTGGSGGNFNLRKQIGHTPHGLKPKDLIGIPWMLAFALRDDGWYLRSDIIWAKPNPMPESVTDRPTKAHEYLFLLTKRARYFYDSDAIREAPTGRTDPMRFWKSGMEDAATGQRQDANRIRNLDGDIGRNKRSVWEIATEPFSGASLLADYVGSDGRPYRVSPDCPVHGTRGQSRRQLTAGCGEPSGRQESHNLGIGDGHAEARSGECASIPSIPNDASSEASVQQRIPQNTDASRTTSDFLHEPVLVDSGGTVPRNDHTSELATPSPDSSGLLGQPCSDVAILSNTESHRTAHAPATSLPYSVSARRSVSTDGMSVLPGFDVQSVHMPANSNGLVGLDGRPLAQTKPRNADRSCSCQIISTAHFATYPTALVEPCIKAGTSERGVCSACGAPWVRIIDGTKYEPIVVAVGERNVDLSRGDKVRKLSGAEYNAQVQRITTGWRPSCVHAESFPTPATVLDPFCGAGTTLLVADRLQRSAIGIELNVIYADMARRRCIADSPMFTEVAAD